MSLSKKEAAQFARSAVECDPAVLAARNPEAKARRLAYARRNALGFYGQAQDDVRQSGYRCTQRVKDIIWTVLNEIRDAALAPCILPRTAVTSIAMTTGGEKRHPVVVMAGDRMRWIGFVWVNEGLAAPSDKAKLPMVMT